MTAGTEIQPRCMRTAQGKNTCTMTGTSASAGQTGTATPCACHMTATTGLKSIRCLWEEKSGMHMMRQETCCPKRMQIIFIGIAIFIVLLIFLKMKYGIYGKNDFNNLFNQSKEEILKNYGNPIEDKMLNTRSERLTYDKIDFIVSSSSPQKPDSIRVTDPNIRFGILKIGVGSTRREVMLAYGLKKTLKNDKGNAYSVQNGVYVTTFYFNDNDRVYKIACGISI